MYTKKLLTIFFTLISILACSLLATPEPPGVGEKAELGYAACEPIITALAKYQADTASYPETLDELVPAYLTTLPTEVNGESINYSKTGGEYSLSFHYVGPGMNTCTYTPKNKWQCSGAY
ncbi:MAG: hypothetical protein U0Z26_14830 [Anaerolineales bacterium]